ncbi:diiron oxygenase [Caldimonas brevitalea]|uniref:Para-aminobenzoate N-oxygenase AurF n=1 Tax=Caldimonas brevitalea TaxID=413882 RepID=A0A0G3BJ04_9BURK|nr:diiron oxygenase [Caldimonas brevitalea]AKJ29424.1 hypothetical protein AAW51_2733 [Caldimonas brevitalea]
MYTHIVRDAGLPDRVTAALADSWANRVAVKVGELDLKRYYDKNIPDYPPNLVPFRDDPRYGALDAEMRQRILAGAWVAYNEKTVDVETSIVAPACALLLKGAFQGLQTAELKRIIVQTQIDEQYHILMCLDACLLSRAMHGIEGLTVPQSWVVQQLEHALQQQTCARDAHIVQLGFATVAEVTINSYLDLLAQDQTIQPFNRETTALHRRDESAHNKIFTVITRQVYTHFSEHDRAVFRSAIATGLDAFVTIDLRAWREILRYLNVPDGSDIVDACERANGSKRLVRDFSGFRALLREIEVAESEIDFDFA